METQEYLIVNNYDGNDSFTVEATSAEEAAHKALNELGWWVAKPDEDAEDNQLMLNLLKKQQ